MTTLPGALFLVDPTKEKIALAEAKNVGIPVIAVVDTNCNPSGIDYIIAANDDAIKAIKLMCNRLSDAVLEGKMLREAGESGMAQLAPTESDNTKLMESHTFAPDEAS
jgi:small subunit ribosomal protein S2